MRIIGGEQKGRKLFSVQDSVTRPTADRLRETIFNILYTSVRKSIVLDLFAGTGALGIEALSRGAEYAVFVDNNRKVSSVIEKNIKLCGFADKAKIITIDVIRNLKPIKSMSMSFDLVFIDPPYGMGFIKKTLYNLSTTCCLGKKASVIAEHNGLEPVPDDIYGFKLKERRKYGKTFVSFLDYAK